MTVFLIDVCHNCPNRQINCHSTCKEYKEQKKLYEESKESFKAERDKEIALNAIGKKRYKRIAKAKGSDI